MVRGVVRRAPLPLAWRPPASVSSLRWLPQPPHLRRSRLSLPATGPIRDSRGFAGFPSFSLRRSRLSLPAAGPIRDSRGSAGFPSFPPCRSRLSLPTAGPVRDRRESPLPSSPSSLASVEGSPPVVGGGLSAALLPFGASEPGSAPAGSGPPPEGALPPFPASRPSPLLS